MSTAASVSATPRYLPATDRWAPATSLDGDRVVMPLTFPDGTTAELAYPAKLRLEGMSVYPDTYVKGPRACGLSVGATRYDPHVGWITGDAPLARHVTMDGAAVELWAGTPDHAPYDFLVYRFGSWSVLVPCRGAIDDQEIATWAENLQGSESGEGLLVLDSEGPLEVNPFEDRNGPTIRLSDRNVVIDLTVGPEACGWELDDRNLGADDTVRSSLQSIISPPQTWDESENGK